MYVQIVSIRIPFPHIKMCNETLPPKKDLGLLLWDLGQMKIMVRLRMVTLGSKTIENYGCSGHR